MRRLKYLAVFLSCLIIVSGWLSPISRASLAAGATDSSGSDTPYGTGLAPAMPPNMENSGGKTAFSPIETSPAGEFKTDGYTAACCMISKIVTVRFGYARGARPSGGGARTGGFEVMLC